MGDIYEWPEVPISAALRAMPYAVRQHRLTGVYQMLDGDMEPMRFGRRLGAQGGCGAAYAYTSRLGYPDMLDESAARYEDHTEGSWRRTWYLYDRSPFSSPSYAAVMSWQPIRPVHTVDYHPRHYIDLGLITSALQSFDVACRHDEGIPMTAERGAKLLHRVRFSVDWHAEKLKAATRE
tara:strand:- start:258 stop:794 length:537 start_codon:yes stop_codon:yes gene_type:complete